MKKLALTSVAAVTLLCAAAISNAQDRDRPQATTTHMEGMHRGAGGHRGEFDTDHRRTPTVIVVGVPIFVGPVYTPYYAAAPMELYQTIDGFYYYCANPSGYHPAVRECPDGWRLVP